MFLYVRHKDVWKKMLNGWMVVSSLGNHHSHYAVLMWHCECFNPMEAGDAGRIKN